jgi:hypothetical protein
MKKSIILLSAILFSLVTIAQEGAVLTEPVNGPEITFSEKKYDFGDITQGEVVEHVFVFQNTGNQPLILSNVLTTCGCTVPSWPREPIAPGEESEITVKYNSRGKIGMQNKVITIVSNAVNPRTRVVITTNVTLPRTEG